MSHGMAQRNYYHWTIEMLGQLRLVEAAGLKYDYIAAPARHGFARQSLELLGAQPSQIVPLGHFTHVQADRLIVPSIACTFPHPASVAFLRERMRIQPWSHYQREDRLRLYISRPRRRIRHVVNEQELLAAIRPLGFEPVELDNLPLKQQIQLFQRAEAVVGPHGAGFTNLVYARPDAAVFEIAPASRPAVFFHYLAEINDQRYMVYFGQPVQQKGTEANIKVDVDAVRGCMADFLDDKSANRGSAAA
jgi:capsular polysaccharide biosynthesis protein